MKIEPGGTVGSLQDLATVARALEAQAARVYEKVAARLATEGSAPVVLVLQGLADEHRRRLDSIDVDGALPAQPLDWQPDGAFDDEGLATVSPQLLTRYRVLSTAVRNEERAFALWTYMAAHAPNDRVRQAAETMARQRLADAARRRSERRVAYRAERSGGRAGQEAIAGPLGPGDDPLIAAELMLLDMIGKMERGTEDRLRQAEFAGLAHLHIQKLRLHPLATGTGVDMLLPAHADAVSVAEFLAQSYLEAADAFSDEEQLGLAQELAQSAVRRLAWLRGQPGGTHS